MEGRKARVRSQKPRRHPSPPEPKACGTGALKAWAPWGTTLPWAPERCPPPPGRCITQERGSPFQASDDGEPGAVWDLFIPPTRTRGEIGGCTGWDNGHLVLTHLSVRHSWDFNMNLFCLNAANSFTPFQSQWFSWCFWVVSDTKVLMQERLHILFPLPRMLSLTYVLLKSLDTVSNIWTSYLSPFTHFISLFPAFYI